MSSTVSSKTSDLIRSLRERLDLSQVKFAKQLGVSFQTVNGWENGHHQPSRIAMKLIRGQIEALGDQGEDLLNEYFS
ncbi:MAG: helix-turn-helix domain-containing protein [Microcoleaceae cyanobacterium]